MLEIFNYIERLKTDNFGLGVDREMVLFCKMVNEKEHLILVNDMDFLKENKDIDRLIEFIVYCVGKELYNFLNKSDFKGIYNFIIRALIMFKLYGNEKTNKEEFIKIMGCKS